MLKPLVPSKRDRSMAYRIFWCSELKALKAARITNNNAVQISRYVTATRDNEVSLEIACPRP